MCIYIGRRNRIEESFVGVDPTVSVYAVGKRSAHLVADVVFHIVIKSGEGKTRLDLIKSEGLSEG